MAMLTTKNYHFQFINDQNNGQRSSSEKVVYYYTEVIKFMHEILSIKTFFACRPLNCARSLITITLPPLVVACHDCSIVFSPVFLQLSSSRLTRVTRYGCSCLADIPARTSTLGLPVSDVYLLGR